MADTSDPNVKQFTVHDLKTKNNCTIYLGPQVAIIGVTKWEWDENGQAKDIGKRQSVTIPRHSLIGLAYEILQSMHTTGIIPTNPPPREVMDR